MKDAIAMVLYERQPDDKKGVRLGERAALAARETVMHSCQDDANAVISLLCFKLNNITNPHHGERWYGFADGIQTIIDILRPELKQERKEGGDR